MWPLLPVAGISGRIFMPEGERLSKKRIVRGQLGNFGDNLLPNARALSFDIQAKKGLFILYPS